MSKDEAYASHHFDTETLRKARDDDRKLVEINEQEDLRWVLGDERGRRFLWGLLGETHMFQSVPPGAIEEVAYRNGERNVGCRLLAKIMQTNIDAFPQMMKEATHASRTSSSAGKRKP